MGITIIPNISAAKVLVEIYWTNKDNFTFALNKSKYFFLLLNIDEQVELYSNVCRLRIMQLSFIVKLLLE